MIAEGLRDYRAFEVCMYQLSDLERDALNHYPRIPSSGLIKDLRSGVMVMQGILSELWRKGVRLRIVPKDTNLTDLPECLDLKKHKTEDGRNYYDVVPAGLYRSQYKLIVIKEEHLLDADSINQKFWVLVHEFAHAIWYLILEQSERDYVDQLFVEESRRRPNSMEYRMTNSHEFFADGFRYYVTPHRQSAIVRVTKELAFDGTEIEVQHEANLQPSKVNLQDLNLKLYAFLEGKFKGIIDPELVMAKPVGNGEEERFEFYSDTGLYGPVIYCGVVGDPTGIITVVDLSQGRTK